MARMSKKYWAAYREANREKMRGYEHAHRKRNPLANRAKILKKYGLTLEQYAEMAIKQNGLCALCHKKESSKHHKSGMLKSLAVDHCHKTGKVRGLLCSHCNKSIGAFKDDPDFLLSAVLYLLPLKNLYRAVFLHRYKRKNGQSKLTVPQSLRIQ